MTSQSILLCEACDSPNSFIKGDIAEHAVGKPFSLLGLKGLLTNVVQNMGTATHMNGTLSYYTTNDMERRK